MVQMQCFLQIFKHTDPDYSCAYVIIHTNSAFKGYGLTFTLGKGTEIVVTAIRALEYLVIGKSVNSIFTNFSTFWRSLTSESQLRWLGPEKGVIHLATAAIINGLWDLWARLENKPVWELLSNLTPEQLVSTIDFRYITDSITREEAIEILKKEARFKKQRINEIVKKGYPAYTTQVGWLGYSDDKMKQLCEKYLEKGFTAFKLKVGQNLENDIERCRMVRNCIGYENKLMLDANQVWDINVAIDWMKKLTEFKPLWIEEPTAPDDILGHATIARALEEFHIGVATGEMCANRIIFKQLMQANAIKYCQIDSARVGGINELLPIYLMAKKFGVKVCPHAGGIGLCEMVQHLQYWDYICLTGSMEDKWIEYVDQQHEHFKYPVVIVKGRYMPRREPGYNCEMHESTLRKYEFPDGEEWKR
ncbi:mitochondrial enolase superfamily member 1-like isoform X2 [Rhodnius prolixus]|uniref:mitochondrial enolase superfamily member 1-like isoform X2 n=1 Tax=Rhodnius prolixus TaxID=13249 RepID=UPI003D18A7B4